MDLMSFVREHCKKYNISLITTTEDSIPYPGSNLPCAGYFVVKDNNPRLGVAMGFDQWQETLLHELCHSQQWIDNALEWRDNYLTDDERHRLGITSSNAEALDVLDLWEQHKIELSPEDLTNFTNRAIEVERDCEQRTVRVGKEFLPNFDPVMYTKKANAYLRFYKYVEMKRRWNSAGNPPYADEAVVKAQRDTFDQYYLEPLTESELAVFDEYISRTDKTIDNQLSDHIRAIRERSGSVTIDCKVTSFLYTLLRDHVQPGDVEDIMNNHISDEPVEYCNGWLANYAHDVAQRLLSKQNETTQLKDADWHLEQDEMRF